MSDNYNDESIKQLKGADRIRKRPASVLGSSGLAGARHGFTEIYGNALDEKSAGYGDRLDVTYHTDGSISVRDYGRGVPMGWNEKEHGWNWHIIYNELYGGGKFDNDQVGLSRVKDWSSFDPTEFNYLFSVGLNGLGAASTQYTSEFFEVTSYRDGKATKRLFKHGIPVINGEPFDMFSATAEEIRALPEEISPTSEPDGTLIHWKPDIEVFDDVNVGGDWLLDTCRDISGVAGITLHFIDEQNSIDIEIEKGTIVDTLKFYVRENGIKDDTGADVIFQTSVFDHGTTKSGGENIIWVCKADIAFCPTKHEIPHHCFHNSVKMSGGRQYDAIYNAVSQFLEEQAKYQGVRLEAGDYRDAFSFVISSYSNYASFRNQTKDAIDDLFIYTLLRDAIYNKLALEYGKGNKYIVELVQRVINEAQIRVTAKEQAKIIREATKVKREKEPDKFVSCDMYEKKQYDKAELWITEGDSAKGSVKDARDKVFQAIYPIRGKGLNVTKATLDRVLKNKEIREIFALIGTGFDLPLDGEKTFDINDLRFDKIIFATDADEDGYQIRVLLFLIFYKLAPQLITDGHVYIAETPRFKIDFEDKTSVYAKNDAERDRIIKESAENGSKIRNISRFKGLGEVNANILRETTVAPEHRNLIQLNCNLQNDTERDMIDALFGADKYGQRKSIISEVLGCGVADMLEENALMLKAIEDDDTIEDGVDYQVVEQ